MLSSRAAARVEVTGGQSATCDVRGDRDRRVTTGRCEARGWLVAGAWSCSVIYLPNLSTATVLISGSYTYCQVFTRRLVPARRALSPCVMLVVLRPGRRPGRPDADRPATSGLQPGVAAGARGVWPVAARGGSRAGRVAWCGVAVGACPDGPAASDGRQAGTDARARSRYAGPAAGPVASRRCRPPGQQRRRGDPGGRPPGRPRT